MTDLITIKNIIKPFYLFKLASSLGTQLVSLFLIYLFTPEEYGQLALILTVAQFMYIITSGWTEPTIVNLGTREFTETGSYKNIVYYRGIIVLFCWLLVSIAFLSFHSSVINIIKNDTYYGVTYLLFISFSLQSMFNQLLYPAKRNFLQSSFDLTYTILLIIIVISCVRNVESYIYVQVALNTLYAITASTVFYQLLKKQQFKFSSKDFIKTFNFSVWQILGVLGIYLTNLGVNYVFTIKNISIDKIGLYNVAYKLFSEFTPIFAICVIVIPQWIYGTADKRKLLNDINAKLIIGITMLSIAYLAIYLILTPFLKLIGKTDYTPSVDFYLFLFPAFVFMAYSQILQLIIMTTPAFKHIQYATLIQGILLVASCFILISFWGIIGAIISVTLAFAGKSVYLSIIYRKKAKIMILNDEKYE